jgi:hypothetical protein
MIEGNGYALLPGNCLEVLREYPNGSFDSIVCDPLHENIPEPVVWAEISRVAAPGAFLLAFGHSRTWHRLACAIEDAGWVYFDTLGQLISPEVQSHRRLRRGWRPIVLACKGLDVLQSANMRCPTTVGDFTLGELVKLVTPPGGCVLDPFMGSGVTGIAALAEGFTFVGIDADLANLEIARKRLEG